MQLRSIIQTLEACAPLELQESYDNAGLQCGDPHQEVSRVLTCLDVTEATVAEAIDRGCQLILSHHPLLFHGVKCISPEAGYIPRVLIEAIRNGIAIYSAHTNLDKARGGTNDYLADLLGLTDLQPLASCGVWGRLAQPLPAEQLLALVEQRLHTRVRHSSLSSQFSSLDPQLLHTLALCTGSGASAIPEVEALGVDAFLTGEVGYHHFFGHPSLLLIEAGHYETEQFVTSIFARILTPLAPALECLSSQSMACPSPFFD